MSMRLRLRHFLAALVFAAVAALTVFILRDPDVRERPRSNSPGKPPPSAPAVPENDPQLRVPSISYRTNSIAQQSPKSGAHAARDPATAINAFRAWSTRFLCETDEASRRALVNEGVGLAEVRRAALHDLIARDPEAALLAAVPWAVRSAMPAEVSALLEERVSGLGDFRAIAARPASDDDAGFASVRREAVIDGQSYEAFVYGRRAALASRGGIGLHGIAVGGRLALLDNPVRVLDPGEPVPAGRKVDEYCAVSGKPAGPEVAPPDLEITAADTGDRVVYLCSAGHIALLAAELLRQENAPAAASAGDTTSGNVYAASSSSYTTGTKKVLFIRVRFSDQAAETSPVTEAGALSLISEANDFFAANSFGVTSLAGTVTPVYALPQTAQWYQSNDTSGYALNILQAARAVAADPSTAAGNAGLAAFNYADFDFEVVRYDGGPGAFSGQGYVGLRGCWLKISSGGVLAHELGHNLGLWHANYWNATDPRTIVGPGANVEYGDGFDTMGQSSAGAWHFNTYEKNLLAWLPDAEVETISTSGVYRVQAHDLGGALDARQRYALKVRRDTDRDYWLEFRQNAGWQSNRWIMSGLGVRWDPWTSSNGGSQLLDTTPLSPDGKADSAVVIGRTYADPVAGIYVTPLAKAGTSPEALDVDVRIGAFAGNRAPVVALTASSLVVAPGQNVNLIANATDADGDALAYFWEFGDRTLGPNGAVTSKSWNVAGDYRVRVTASDRKGGTASASVMIAVGAPTTFRIAGKIFDLAGNPIPDARVSNGLAAANAAYRDAVTDADGTFVLTNLSTGSWTLVATRPGWTFARSGFANPVRTPEDSGVAANFVGRSDGFRITGSVRSADGSLVRGAIVSNGIDSEPTDASGSFAFSGAAPGTYTLSVIPPAGSDAIFDVTTVPVSFADATGVVISEKTFTLSGELSGISASTLVTVTDGWRATTSYQQGTGASARAVFSLPGVPAGSWHLRAVGGGASFAPMNFQDPLAVSGNLAGLVFVKEAVTTFAISGRVTDQGEGVPGATVSADSISTTTDSRGAYRLAGLAAGSYSITAGAAGLTFSPASRGVTITAFDVGGQDFAATRVNAAPFFTRAAVATPPLDGPFIALSARADDDGGAALVRYAWSVVGAVPALVSFSSSGTNGSRDVVALFSAAGTYHLRVTATDALGASSSSDVVVTLAQAPIRLAVSPASIAAALGGNVQFSARCIDQFGAQMSTPSPVAWAVTGGGTIDNSGKFTPTAPGEHFIVSATMSGLTASGNFSVVYAAGPGTGITREVWSGIPGTAVGDLTNAPAFPANPTSTSLLGDFLEPRPGTEHGYGERLRGYFVPPAAGDYVFVVASNNASELWLSASSDASGRRLVASVTTSTGFREWTATPAQRSEPITLKAGQAVYIEVLHKEDAGDDHLSVGVELPGGISEKPIPADRLLPWGAPVFAPPTIVTPADANPTVVGAALRTSLSVAAASEGGESALTYSWDVVGTRAGSVAFLPNGTNTARNATATFARAGSYTLRVTVRDAAGQSVESSTTVTVNETLTSWRNRFFSASVLANPALESGVWGGNADPDGDGVVNLLEYAFDLNPLMPAVDGLPQPKFVTIDGDEYLAITFRRNLQATDVTFTPQVSSDLENWQTGLIAIGDPDAGVVTYRDTVPSSGQQKRFIRVEVNGP